MNPVTKTVRIDLAHPGGLDFLSRVYAVQGDAYSRFVAFELYSNGEKYTPPEGTTAIVRYRKDDGTGGNYEVLPDGSAAYTINGNMLTVTLDPQVCIVPGLVQLAVGLILGNAEINTFSVRVVVQPNPGLEYQSESHVKLAGTVADSGWEPNMYLGTDDGGNVTGLSTDKTLNQPGRAADAKATGDAIHSVMDKLASEISRAESAAGEAQDAQTAAAGSAQRAKTEAENARTAAQQAGEAAARAESYAPKDGAVLSVNGKSGVVQLGAQDVAAVPLPAQSLPGEVVRILSVDTATGAVQTDTTPLPDLRPYVRSETVPTAATPGAVRADGQYGVAVRTDATLTTVPATAAQLDRMTEAYAPLTPALLPYGVKKALTSAAGAANWSAQEKTAALLQLGADDRFYSKAEADRKFSTGYTLPCATADVLGGVKVGRGLSVTDDGTLSSDAQGYTLPAATATTLGGVKVGDYLDIAADGTLSGKTLNDKIAAAVAVKSEPRLVWNHHTQSPTKWNTYDVSIPDGVDYVHIKTICDNYTGDEFDLARGGNTSHVFDKVPGDVVCTMTFRADGTLHVQGPHSNSNYGYAIELWLSGYHYPTLAELLTETQAAQADTDALAVDHEYRVAMLELGMTDDTTTDTTT